MSEAFKRIMVKAGIPIEKRLEAAGGIGRGRNKLSFHSFRHSLNSAMANAGVTREIRQKLLGHRDADTNKVYRISISLRSRRPSRLSRHWVNRKVQHDGGGGDECR